MTKGSKRAVLVILLVAVAVLLLATLPNKLIGAVAMRSLRKATGLNLSFDRLHTTFWHPSVRVEGLVVKNPEGFPDEAAIRVEDFFASYDVRSMFSSRKHFYRVDIVLPRIVVVRNARGETNVQRISEEITRRKEPSTLRRLPPPEAPGRPPQAPPPSTPAPVPAPSSPPPAEPMPEPAPEPPEVTIDQLTIAIGTIEYQDYGSGSPPRIRSYALDKTNTFRHVTDLERVGQQLALDLTVQAAPQLLEDLQQSLNENGGDLDKLGKQIEGKAKDLRDALRQFMGN